MWNTIGLIQQFYYAKRSAGCPNYPSEDACPWPKPRLRLIEEVRRIDMLKLTCAAAKTRTQRFFSWLQCNPECSFATHNPPCPSIEAYHYKDATTASDSRWGCSHWLLLRQPVFVNLVQQRHTGQNESYLIQNTLCRTQRECRRAGSRPSTG